METVKNINRPPKLPGPPINPVVENSDEQLPSLSDLHDHEPKLEFDDTELTTTIVQEETYSEQSFVFCDSDEIEEGDDSLEGDNYENHLTSMEPQLAEPFIECIGTDKQGIHIYAIYACRLPVSRELKDFIDIIITKMTPLVQSDYILVYFHQGLQDDNRPSIAFLWNSYKALNRDFRKNLKSLYVVHPTFFIRVVWNFFRPFISEKFKKKLIYISSIDEVRQALGLPLSKLPEDICSFDERINGRRKLANESLSEETVPNTTQFGVSLKFIIDHSPCLNYIPPIVRKCVDSLSITGVIDTEGIFRRSGNYGKINELKQKVNRGEEVDLTDVDVHVIAGLLKSFLRDLSEPLLTFDLYDEIIQFSGWTTEEKSRNVKQMLREKLPVANYELFKYLIEFLVKVMECEDLNKMTSSNLAIVFGPNLVWARHNQMSLEEIAPINSFIDFVLQNHKDIYLVDINKEEPID